MAEYDFDDGFDDGMVEDYENELEEQIDEVNDERIIKRIEKANTSELCGLLKINKDPMIIEYAAEIYFMFDEGRLPASLRNKIQTHLDLCPNCRGQYGKYRAMSDQVDRLLRDLGKQERENK